MENNTERNHWQALLSKVEVDLAELERKSLQLRSMRSYLRGLLELPIEEKAEVPIIPGVEVGVHTGVLPKFRKGDFYGFTQAEAAYSVLQRAGGSLTIDEILQVLQDSGYEGVGGQDPKRTLYSSLCRSRKLVKVAENTFDLAERRPKPRKTKEPEETKERAQSKGQTQTAPKAREEKESE